ncbi:hypothetical protein MS3_00006450 [Schistosoma haematobium]|uniref:Uncharacterized protein n=1 Tax=Schistosoma haematobium TaxID=6185 RepID=A0A922LV31_SCHHA|nr:hypothetical protein MS3_00006450 [Schistosoma haematobium]KAH9594490.1 hypothetical protein MS3_00006450 [Schistosoma haematobium]CAH8445666.1 unnamed protein product [Schistosoma haematobium]CAH8445944.1 unnamed protein product [Schistosoma haematobium]
MTTEQQQDKTFKNSDEPQLDTNKEDDTLFEYSKVSEVETVSKDKLPNSLSQISVNTQPLNDYDKSQEATNSTDNTPTSDTKSKTNVPPLKKIIRSSITETEEVKEKSVKSYFDTVSSAGYPTSPPDFSDYVKTRVTNKYPSYSSSCSSYQYHHHVENLPKKSDENINGHSNLTSHKVLSTVTKLAPESNVPQTNNYESISRPQISVPIKIRRIPQDVRVIHTSNTPTLNRLDEFKRSCERATRQWEQVINNKNGNKLTEEIMVRRIAELESCVKEAENLLKLFVAEVRDVRATADYWSKKTTNLEKSYHNLHGKVKDYRFNAKQSENEYLKAMEERDYFLQSLRESETREQNLSNLLQRVEDEYNTLSRDIRILERAHAKKDRQLQNLLLEKNELSRKIIHLESTLHKLKNRAEYTYRQKHSSHKDEPISRLHTQLGDESEYVLSDFGSLDRNQKIYTMTASIDERQNKNTLIGINQNLDDSDTYIPQKSDSFKVCGSVELLDGKKQSYLSNKNMSDSLITTKISENNINTQDHKDSLDDQNIDLSPTTIGNDEQIHHQSEHLIQHRSVEKSMDDLSDTLVDLNNLTRQDDMDIEIQPRDSTNNYHRKWSIASDYQYSPNQHIKSLKKDALSTEDESLKHRSQVQVVVGRSPSTEKKRRTVHTSHSHKKYSYKKIFDQPVLPSVFSTNSLRFNRHRPASVSGYLDECALNRSYDLYPVPSSARPSTSFGHLHNSKRLKSLERDYYTSCQNLSTKPYSTVKLNRQVNRQPLIIHSHSDRRLRDMQHANYLRHGNRMDNEYERIYFPQSYSSHHLKIPEKDELVSSRSCKELNISYKKKTCLESSLDHINLEVDRLRDCIKLLNP